MEVSLKHSSDRKKILRTIIDYFFYYHYKSKYGYRDGGGILSHLLVFGFDGKIPKRYLNSSVLDIFMLACAYKGLKRAAPKQVIDAFTTKNPDPTIKETIAVFYDHADTLGLLPQRKSERLRLARSVLLICRKHSPLWAFKTVLLEKKFIRDENICNILSKELLKKFETRIKHYIRKNAEYALVNLGYKLSKDLLSDCIILAPHTAFHQLYSTADVYLKRKILRCYFSLEENHTIHPDTVLNLLQGRVPAKAPILPEFYPTIIDRGLLFVLSEGASTPPCFYSFIEQWYGNRELLINTTTKNLWSALKFIEEVLKLAIWCKFSIGTVRRCLVNFVRLFYLAHNEACPDVKGAKLFSVITNEQITEYLRGEYILITCFIQLILYCYKGKITKELAKWCYQQNSLIFVDSIKQFCPNEIEAILNLATDGNNVYNGCPSVSNQLDINLLEYLKRNPSYSKEMVPISITLLERMKDRAPEWAIYSVLTNLSIKTYHWMYQFVPTRFWHKYWREFEPMLLTLAKSHYLIELKDVPRQLLSKYLKEIGDKQIYYWKKSNNSLKELISYNFLRSTPFPNTVASYFCKVLDAPYTGKSSRRIASAWIKRLSSGDFLDFLDFNLALGILIRNEYPDDIIWDFLSAVYLAIVKKGCNKLTESCGDLG